jgi:hypothetical protein
MNTILQTSIPENPLVKLLKIKKGIIEKITPLDSGGLDFIIQQLLYAYPERNIKKTTFLDVTPVVFILSVIQDKKKYELFPLPFKSFVAGIFGINLNLLFSDDEKSSSILHKIKSKILTSYIIYNSSSDEVKKRILKELKEIVIELIEIDKSKKVFVQSPFQSFETRHILFSQTLKDPKQITAYKNSSHVVLDVKSPSKNPLTKGKNTVTMSKIGSKFNPPRQSEERKP